MYFNSRIIVTSSIILNYYLSSHHKILMPCTSPIFTGDASAKDIDTAMKLGAGKNHVFIIFFIASFELIVIVILLGRF